jgi:hypothetical protein
MTVATEAWGLALGTLPVSEGLRLREAAEVRYFPSTDPARFHKLAGIRDLDAFLASDAARVPRVCLADSSRDGSSAVPHGDYTASEEGHLDLPRLFALYDAGATLVLSQMNEVHPPLGRFCRGLERVFLHAVQCNVYLTPPGAQGFRAHYDTHDVLILQVQGEKLWRYWPTPPVPFANNRTPWESQPLPPEEPRTQMMRPGDVLYVPRGILHDAASQGTQSSLHLTIGLLGQSWGDALHAALNVMERDDPTLRQLFPTWRLAEGGISDDLMREAAKRLAALSTVSVMELMSQKLLTKLATEQMSMVSRGLIAPTVSSTDRLYLSDTVHHFVVPRPDGTAELRWAGGNLTLTAEEFGWIARLDEGASARDLGGAEALAFCQKLASAGLITVRPVTAMKAAE